MEYDHLIIKYKGMEWLARFEQKFSKNILDSSVKMKLHIIWKVHSDGNVLDVLS